MRSSTGGWRWTFRAELTWFERKLYASLSHEPNKAMNLNSYIGLMGGSYEVAAPAAAAPCCAPTREPDSSSPTPTTCSRSTPTASCCPSTACGSST